MLENNPKTLFKIQPKLFAFLLLVLWGFFLCVSSCLSNGNWLTESGLHAGLDKINERSDRKKEREFLVIGVCFFETFFNFFCWDVRD